MLKAQLTLLPSLARAGHSEASTLFLKDNFVLVLVLDVQLKNKRLPAHGAGFVLAKPRNDAVVVENMFTIQQSNRFI